MDITIAPARVFEIGDILSLDREAFGPDAWSLPDFIFLFDTPGAKRFTARADGQFAGFAAAEIERKTGELWISTLAVREAYRCRGIGTKLLSACEHSGLHTRCCLQVSERNLEAQKLYRKHGYVVTGRQPAYYFSGADALIMEKTDEETV